MPAQQAESIAAAVGAGVLAAYNDAVRAEALPWLAELNDSELDRVPDFRAQQERGGYARPEVWQEIADLEGLPVGIFLLRPCVSHVRVHLGEIDLLLQLANQGSA